MRDREGPARPGFAVTVAFDLHPGCRERFLDLVRANAAASVEREPECFRFDVLVAPAGMAPEVVLYEIYADRAAFGAHLQSPHFTAFDAATGTMVKRKRVSEFQVEQNARTATGEAG